MEQYESEQQRILRPANMIYRTLSDFSNFTPILQDKVDSWDATADRCNFTVKGFNLALQIVEREENKLIKIEGDDGTPFDFTMWIQLVEVEPADTRMRLVSKVKLNAMMKMMLGKKIEEGINAMAEQIAFAFNNAPEAGFAETILDE